MQRFPAEWSRQDGVLLTWPHEHSKWIASLEVVEKIFVTIAKHVAYREKLIINCFSQKHSEHVKDLLENEKVNMPAVTLLIIPSNDIWVRDHGPITVFKGKKPVLLSFAFNGWGNKYPSDKDSQITKLLHTKNIFNDVPLKIIDLVLEGGSIETDGHGTLLTTTRCLLAKNRNPYLKKADIEAQLKTHLGINRFLWLEHGYVSGDDTDGHIDTLARFTDPHTICHLCCDNASDEHDEALKAMEKQLANFKDYQGNPYRLVPLPWPKPKFSLRDNTKRLPNTYANFLIINDAVLVPTYHDPADEKALQQIRQCFPDRDVIGVSCEQLIEQYGSLHCVTMQLPKGVLK